MMPARKYLLLTAFLVMVALRGIASQGYYKDGVTVSGPHGDYTTMRGENNCGACHIATTTAWAILPVMTCVPTPTWRETTCFQVRSTWGWKGSFNAGRRYLDSVCLSRHNTTGRATPKMVLRSAQLASILNTGPSPLSSWSIGTANAVVLSGGTSILSSGPPLSSTLYQCPRCHEPHFENHTGLDYLKPGVQ